MENEQLKALINNNIEPHLYMIEVWQCINALGIKPNKLTDDWWCFSYVENDKEKILGYGHTIDCAACDFYNNLKIGGTKYKT